MKNTILSICIAIAALLPASNGTDGQDYLYSRSKEIICLADNIWHEARGESYAGQVAVAMVSINRVKSKIYPGNICKVVWQNKQFSWTFDNKAKKRLPNIQARVATPSYQKAMVIARKALEGHIALQGLPSNALWYHSHAVNPKWNRGMKKVLTVGSHIFYSSEID